MSANDMEYEVLSKEERREQRRLRRIRNQRLAMAGLAEKFKKIPMRMIMEIRDSKTLSTVHHQLAIMLRLFLENEITCCFSYKTMSEVRPKIPSMNAIIQKRTTTVVSFQPSCSKW